MKVLMCTFKNSNLPFGFPWVANQPSLSSLSIRTSIPAASYSSSTHAALRKQGTEEENRFPSISKGTWHNQAQRYHRD